MVIIPGKHRQQVTVSQSQVFVALVASIATFQKAVCDGEKLRMVHLLMAS